MNDLTLFLSTPEKKSIKTEIQYYGIDLVITNFTVAEIVFQQREKPDFGYSKKTRPTSMDYKMLSDRKVVTFKCFDIMNR